MRGRRWAGALALGAVFALAPASWGQVAAGRPVPGVWRVSADSQAMVFAEQTTVGPGQGDTVRMPSVWVLRTPQQTPLGQMKYFIAIYEYDCSASRLRLVQISTYKGDGDMLEPDLGSTGFEQPPPGSLNGAMLRAACSPFAAWPQIGAQRISTESQPAVDLAAYADAEFANSTARY